MGNSDKGNARFLGDFKEEKTMAQHERDVCLSALKAIAGIEAWIQDAEMKRHFQTVVYGTIESIENPPPPSPCFFIGTETGITDIDTPPSDN